jgi:hypothetical protein
MPTVAILAVPIVAIVRSADDVVPVYGSIDINVSIDVNVPIDINVSIDVNVPIDIKVSVDVNVPVDVNVAMNRFSES